MVSAEWRVNEVSAEQFPCYCSISTAVASVDGLVPHCWSRPLVELGNQLNCCSCCHHQKLSASTTTVIIAPSSQSQSRCIHRYLLQHRSPFPGTSLICPSYSTHIQNALFLLSPCAINFSPLLMVSALFSFHQSISWVGGTTLLLRGNVTLMIQSSSCSFCCQRKPLYYLQGTIWGTICNKPRSSP